MIGSRKARFILAAGVLSAAAGGAGQAWSMSNVSFPEATMRFSDDKVIEIEAILAKPDGNGPFPAVVLLHSCGGMQPHVSHDWPNYLTGLGYVTLTPNSFGARYIEKCTSGYSTEEIGWELREHARDAYGALQYLSSLPYVDTNKVAVMGFSFGANVINTIIVSARFQRGIRVSRGMNFRAGIAFYGRCQQLKHVRETPFPLIQIIGGKDLFADQCAKLGHPTIKVHVIPGAYHHFDGNANSGHHDLAGNYLAYDGEARDKSREIVRAFLAREFAKPYSPSPGFAGRTRPGPTPDSFLKCMDKDGDGRVSRKEFLGQPQRWPIMDANGDGYLVKSEIEAALDRFLGGKQVAAARPAGPPAATPEPGPAPGFAAHKLSKASPERFLKHQDKDGDGRISRKEFIGQPQYWPIIDANGDGYLVKSEIKAAFDRVQGRNQVAAARPAGPPATTPEPCARPGAPHPAPSPGFAAGKLAKPSPERFLKRMDKDGDGRISRKEFLGQPQRWPIMDANDDGYLDKSEIEAALDRFLGGKQVAAARPANPPAMQTEPTDGPDRPLSESAIRSLVTGNTLRFNAPLGGQLLHVHFGANGTATVARPRDPDKKFRQKWFVNEEGMLCRLVGRRKLHHCMTVRRTAKANVLRLSNKKKGVSYEATMLEGMQLSNRN